MKVEAVVYPSGLRPRTNLVVSGSSGIEFGDCHAMAEWHHDGETGGAHAATFSTQDALQTVIDASAQMAGAPITEITTVNYDLIARIRAARLNG